MKKILVALTIAFTSFASAADSIRPSREVRNSMRDETALNIFFSANKVPRERTVDLNLVDEEIMIDVKRNREMRTVKLSNWKTPALKEVKLTISMPVERDPQATYPVIFVLPGLYSENDIVNYINNPGNNIIVSIQYPFGNLNPALVLQMSKLHELFLALPVQVASSIAWIKDQSYVDKNRVSLMGVSLGGHLLPLCQRFLQEQGESVHSSVIAYAGINAHEIFSDSIDKRMGRKEARIVKQILTVALTPFEPSTHLPYLTGNFLVIYGSEDTFISPQSSKRLYDRLPSPKAEYALPGGHINAESPDLIDTLTEETFYWLSEVGAI